MAKGWKQTEEAKKRMSEAKLGMKRSEEYKQKLSEVMKSKFASGKIKKQHRAWGLEQKAKMEAYWAKPKSEEVRRQISETMKQKIISGDFVVKQHSWPKGKSLSEETKDKLSLANSKQIIEGRFKFGASYGDLHLQNEKELLFILWCDQNDVAWVYQPNIFLIKRGNRYIPDFLLPGSNQFVEVGELNNKKVEKMNAFVSSGNVLHHINGLIDLGERTRWTMKSV
jgi:hypothetical protein